MRASAKLLILMGGFNPYRAPGIVSRYNVNDLSSLVYDGSDRIGVTGDLSGNSPRNELILNGNQSSYASFAALTAFGTGNFTVSARVRLFSLSAPCMFLSGLTNALAMVIGTDGKIESSLSGIGGNTVSTGSISAFQDAVITYVRSGTTGTYYIDAVSAGTTTDSRNYSVGCTQIGRYAVTPSTYLLNGALGWVRCYSVALNAAQVAADAAGTVQSNCIFNADFSLVAKLAASFTEASSNAITVTVNTTGDLGARICGARDIAMLTAAKKLTLSNVAGFWQALGNGTSQYAATAPFSLAQPYAVDVVLTQQTWTINDVLIDGRSADTGELYQDTTTPRLSMYAGNVGPTTTQAAVARKVALTMIFDGASSYIIVNGKPPISGDAGAMTPNGITLAAVASGSANGNVSFNEIIVRAGATVRDLALASKINRALMRKNAVT
jgi:hypothetical protein